MSLSCCAAWARPDGSSTGSCTGHGLQLGPPDCRRAEAGWTQAAPGTCSTGPRVLPPQPPKPRTRLLSCSPQASPAVLFPGAPFPSRCLCPRAVGPAGGHLPPWMVHVPPWDPFQPRPRHGLPRFHLGLPCSPAFGIDDPSLPSGSVRDSW